MVGSNFEFREKYAPQMADYSRIFSVRSPYGLFLNAPNLTSQVVNTDECGFRKCRSRAGDLSVMAAAGKGPVNILVGASTAFGVGASSDKSTIASFLEELTGEPWVSLSVRAANSLQEHIYLLNYALGRLEISRIVFFSGLNDIALHPEGMSDFYGDPFFTMKAHCEMLRKHPVNKMSKKRQLWDLSKSLLGLDSKTSIKPVDSHSGMRAGKSFEEIVERNVLMMKGLSELFPGGVYYFFQPYFEWTGKGRTTEENSLFEELDKAQEGTNWQRVSTWMSEKEALGYKDMAMARLKQEGILGEDCNEWLASSQETLFVDRAHLNDSGYNYVATQISKLIGDRNG